VDRRSELHELLEAHRSLDDREREFRARMLELVAAPGDPFRRDRFDPGHFTASAIVLAPEGRAMLEVYHAKLDRWLQPGGHVEPCDATLDRAARREVEEETGLFELGTEPGAPVPFDLDIHPIPARREEPAHLHFDVRFLFHARTRTCRPGTGARAVRWADLDRGSGRSSDSGLDRVRARLARL